MSATAILKADVPTPNKSFGLLFTVVFLVVAWYLWRRGVAWYPLAVVAAAGFLAAALTRPAVLTPLTRWWMRLALLLNLVFSPLILGLLFFGIFTPIALGMRLFGRDALKLRLDAAAGSYWEKRDPPGPAKGSLRDQF